MQVVLLTVHGTWAAAADWAKPDSALSTQIRGWFAKRGVSATVVPFEWSGRNSLSARQAGGAALAERIDQICRDERPAALYVIAHSHGGSVFAHAVKSRPDIIDQVDGFVALATPWIGLHRCGYAVAFREMLAYLGLYVAFVAILLAVMMIVRDTF